MKFNGFHHIGLAVADVQKSRAFYIALGGTETFNFKIDGKDYYLIDMGGNAVVELIPKLSADSPEQTEPRWMHIALNTDECDAAFDLAIKIGAKEKIAPKDVSLGTLDIRLAFVYGPDGEEIEFFTVKNS